MAEMIPDSGPCPSGQPARATSKPPRGRRSAANTHDQPRAMVLSGTLLLCALPFFTSSGWLFLTSPVGPWTKAFGPVLFGMITLVAFSGFWWFTMRFLLAGRIPWRRLFPSAMATGLCWLGMVAVFAASRKLRRTR